MNILSFLIDFFGTIVLICMAIALVCFIIFMIYVGISELREYLLKHK